MMNLIYDEQNWLKFIYLSNSMVVSSSKEVLRFTDVIFYGIDFNVVKQQNLDKFTLAFKGAKIKKAKKT